MSGLDPARLRQAAGQGLAAVASFATGGSRYCPQCLRANGGRWLLTWRVRWSIACIRHRVLLAERCPACGHTPRLQLASGREPAEAATCTHAVKASRGAVPI